MVLEQWFNHKLGVRYFTELISGSFGNRTVNKIRNSVLDIPPSLLWDNCAAKKWIEADTKIRYFIDFIMGNFGIVPVI